MDATPSSSSSSSSSVKEAEKKKGLVCPNCEREFIYESAFLKHVLRCQNHNFGRRHRGEKLAGMYACRECESYFSRLQYLEAHMKRAHPSNGEPHLFACGICERGFKTQHELREHRVNDHLTPSNFIVMNSAHQGAAVHYRYYFSPDIGTLDEAVDMVEGEIVTLLQSQLVSHKMMKCNLILFVELYKTDAEEELARMETFPFHATAFMAKPFVSLKRLVALAFEQIQAQIGEFTFEGSGWKVLGPLYVDLHTAACLPLAGGHDSQAEDSNYCGVHTIKYPKRGMRIQALEEDLCGSNGLCFYIALVVGLKTLNKYCGFVSYLDFINKMGTPAGRDVKVDDIDLVENDHKWKQFEMGINVVYRDEDNDILPVRASKVPNARNPILLLLFHTISRDGEQKMHYVHVAEPLRLLRYKIKSPSGHPQSIPLHICYNCLNRFWSPEAVANHQKFCFNNPTRAVEMPTPDEKLSFDKQRLTAEERHKSEKTFKSAYMAFYDFESLQVESPHPCACPKEILDNTRRLREQREAWEKMDVEERVEFLIQKRMEESWIDVGDDERLVATQLSMGEVYGMPDAVVDVAAKKKVCVRLKNPPLVSRLQVCGHQEKKLFVQKPFLCSYIVCNREGILVEEETILGLDCAERFLDKMTEAADRLCGSLSPGKPMKITKADKVMILNAKKCYLCDVSFANETKVIDHDHLTGKVLGVAHNSCNINRREQQKLTAFCHNMSGYDSHFLICALASKPKCVRRIDGLPLNMQKFKTLTLNRNVRFLDSLSFLPSNLSQLTDQLQASGCTFEFMNDMVETPREKELLVRKGVFPYRCATSINRLYRTVALPPKRDFYNELDCSHISDEDYSHAHRVWQEFLPKSLLEYAVIYVKTDVRLLAEVVFDLREKIWRDFELDICAYLSLPMLSKDMWLKHTGVEVDLLYDQEMCQLIMDNIRGGLSYINTRSAGIHSIHGKMERELFASRIFYVDANNLYGKAMTMPLPTKDFRWMTQSEIDAFDPLRDIQVESPRGFILEVDLHYPERLHEKHNSFPLAPEKLEITEEMLSPYSAQGLREIYGQTKHTATKLTATLLDKKKYLVHGFNLKYYLEAGLVLKKIHRIITFTQSRCIAPYIEYCTQQRKVAKTETEKNYWKLIVNSLYGKLIESISRRMTARFNTSVQECMRNATNPLFKGQQIYGPELSVAFLAKKSVQMSKNQWAIGFTILELSKLIMQELFYDVIQPRFGATNVDLLMTDTDSFLFNLRTQLSEVECMRKLQDVMDFSNYPKNHPLYDNSRAKELGLLKNEMPAKEIISFVGLKSKSYAIRVADGREELRAKGVPGRAKKHIPLSAMWKCLKRIDSFDVTFRRIGSHNHEIALSELHKRAFSSFDDKRFLFCSQHSAPYGSKFIEEFYRMGRKCPCCRRLSEALTQVRCGRDRKRRRKQSSPCPVRRPSGRLETTWSPSPTPTPRSTTPPLVSLEDVEDVLGVVEDEDENSPFMQLDLDVKRDLGLDESVFDVAMEAAGASQKDLNQNAGG